MSSGNNNNNTLDSFSDKSTQINTHQQCLCLSSSAAGDGSAGGDLNEVVLVDFPRSDLSIYSGAGFISNYFSGKKIKPVVAKLDTYKGRYLHFKRKKDEGELATTTNSHTHINLYRPKYIDLENSLFTTLSLTSYPSAIEFFYLEESGASSSKPAIALATVKRLRESERVNIKNMPTFKQKQLHYIQSSPTHPLHIYVNHTLKHEIELPPCPDGDDLDMEIWLMAEQDIW